MKLIVGLGNPGEKYAGNRHNIGFMAVDEIARGYSFGPWKKRFQGYTAEGQIGLVKCVLVKPSTYMNESGRAVGEAMRFYKIALDDVIVVHDELDLKPGTIRVKTGGGNAGHNGLKSISAHIGNDYRRVRIGIGHPGDKSLVATYVLQDFAKADRDWLLPLLDGVARGMARLVEGGDAAFLSEAVRVQPRRAAKVNGATPPTPEAVVVAKPKEDAIAIIAAAAQKPVQPMPAHGTPVIVSRAGSGGGATSTVFMMQEHQKPSIPEESPKAIPVTAAAIEREVSVDAVPEPATIEPSMPEPAHAATPPSPTTAPLAAGAKVPPPAPSAAASPLQKKRAGLFSSWFRNRVRGGAAQ